VNQEIEARPTVVSDRRPLLFPSFHFQTGPTHQEQISLILRDAHAGELSRQIENAPVLMRFEVFLAKTVADYKKLSLQTGDSGPEPTQTQQHATCDPFPGDAPAACS
jgi:hypothetical protein